MKRNKTIMAIVLVYLIVPLERTIGSSQPNILQDKMDLTGEWVGESDCKSLIKIEHKGTDILMTSMRDGECSKKGEWLMKGSFTENPFKVMLNTYRIDKPSIKDIFEGYAEVISNNLIKITVPNPRKGDRRLVRTVVFIQRRREICNAVGTTRLSNSTLPQPYTGAFGTPDYYEFRYKDFVRRNSTLTPPDYYLNFGKRNLTVFMDRTYLLLSPKGQKFLKVVAVNLQQRIEAKLNCDSSAFAELERYPNLFRSFAYDTHYPAYCESGWADLPFTDQDKIVATTVYTKSLFTREGFSVGWRLLDCSDFRNATPYSQQ